MCLRSMILLLLRRKVILFTLGQSPQIRGKLGTERAGFFSLPTKRLGHFHVELLTYDWQPPWLAACSLRLGAQHNSNRLRPTVKV